MPVATRKLWAKQLQAQHQASIKLSCSVCGISRSAFYYETKTDNDDEVINVLNSIVKSHQRWGFPKCFKRIRALGHKWNCNPPLKRKRLFVENSIKIY